MSICVLSKQGETTTFLPGQLEDILVGLYDQEKITLATLLRASTFIQNCTNVFFRDIKVSPIMLSFLIDSGVVSHKPLDIEIGFSQSNATPVHFTIIERWTDADWNDRNRYPPSRPYSVGYALWLNDFDENKLYKRMIDFYHKDIILKLIYSRAWYDDDARARFFRKYFKPAERK